MTLWNKAQQAAFKLDKALPGWWKLVSLEKLDMNAIGYCVLGQILQTNDRERQARVAEKLSLHPEAIGWHGELGDKTWDELNAKLTEYWDTLIRMRRKKNRKLKTYH